MTGSRLEGAQRVHASFGTPFSAALVLALAVAALPACNCGDDPSDPVIVPFALEVVSGDWQTQRIGEALPEPLAVRVVDAQGEGVPDHVVLFELASAPAGAKGQTLSWAATLTGEDGTAAVTLTLGSAAGDYVVTATAAGELEGSPVTFTATAEPEPPSRLTVVSGDGQSGIAASTLTEPLVVRLVNDEAGPLAGVQVVFEIRSAPAQATGQQLEATTVTTDADGVASALLTLGTRAGAYEVSAVVEDDPGAGEALFVAEAVAGEAAALRLASGDGQSGVVEAAIPGALAAQVVDAHGNPVAGHRVTFALREAPSGAAGHAIDVLETDSDPAGLAETHLTLGTRAGTYVVDASAEPALSGGPVTFVAIATADRATALQLVSGDGQVGPVRGALPRPLLARAVDRHGNVVAGAEVVFSIDEVPAGATGEALSETVVSTGPGGLAATSLTLGTRTGDYTVRATGTGALSESTVTFVATATAAAPVSLVTVSGDLQTAAVTETLSEALVVRLADEHGNPVPDHPVGFVVSAAPEGASGQVLAVTGAASDGLGATSTVLTLGDRPGVYQVRAFAAEGLEATFTATALPGAGYALERVSAEAQQAVVRTAADPLVVRVRDAQGNAVPGHEVTFAIASAPEGAAEHTLGATSVQTDSDGLAATVLTLGTLTGDYTVSAGAGGLFGDPLQFVATGVPGPASVVEAVSGEGQVAQVTQSLPQPFVVRVLDGHGNPVAGHEVSFAVTQTPADAAGHGVAPSAVVTDDAGLAAATLTLGTRAGVYEVSATAASALAGSPVVFAANAVGGAAVALERVSEAHQTATVAEVLQPMVVRVVDAVGNGAAGFPVTFVVQSAPTEGDHAWLEVATETDLDGVASSRLQLGTEAGEYQVTVTAGSLSGSPMSFSATALPGAADAVRVDVNPAVDVRPGQLLDLTLTVVDAHQNTVTDWTGPVSLDLQTDPWGLAPVTVELQASDLGTLTLPASVGFSCADDHLVAADAGTFSGLSPAVSVDPGRLVGVRTELESYGPLDSGWARFSFALGSDWPPDGSIEVVMPQGYDLSSATLTGVEGVDGTFTLSTPDARTAVITRSGSGWVAAGGPVTVQLAGVVNPPQGAEGLITVSTSVADGRRVDTGSFYLRVWRETAAGTDHTCGIDTEGRLWCWGHGRYGRLGNGDGSDHFHSLPVEVSGGHTDWIGVSAGIEHTCGLRAASGGGATLWCWGRNYAYELGIGVGGTRTVPTEVAGQHTDWLEVAAGERFTCGRRGTGETGSLWCWGTGANGRLGNGGLNNQPSPVEVSGAHQDWMGVATGGAHTCGIRSAGGAGTGTMWCWGYGAMGQVGQGSSAESHVPVEVAGWNTDWMFVSAGFRHSCGIRAGGTDEGGALWCWGEGAYGKLGYGETENRFVPVQVASSHTDWVSVAAAQYHTCGLRSVGAAGHATAWCWGEGDNGRLGDRGFVEQTTPVPVHGGETTWVDITAGNAHTCGVRALGTGEGGLLECWGINEHGRLGLGIVHENHTLPVEMDFATSVVQISAGQNHGCALHGDGTVSCWGHGQYGRLGTGDDHRRTTPWEIVGGFADWVKVAAGREHSCAIRDVSASVGGTAWCWGHTYYGRLGNGTSGSSVYQLWPDAVLGGHEDWIDISAGSVHTCGVRAAGTTPGGTAWCWGSGSVGRLGTGNTSSTATPLPVVGAHDDWLMVSAGGSHSCGLRAAGQSGGGTLWCWGYNRYGQLGVNSVTDSAVPLEVVGGFDDWIAVSAGDNHTCAIRAAAAGGKGSLWCWGYGGEGRLGNGGTENRLVPTQVFGDHQDWEQISCGYTHSCGLRASGEGRELWCFGQGSSGQLGNGDIAQWLMPLLVAGGHKDWLSVSAGGVHTHALRPGAAFSWGSNDNVQLGDGTMEKAEPFRVENPLLIE